MADQLKRFAPATSQRSYAPLPPFDIPKLPERLHRISPDDATGWHAAVTEAVRVQFRLLEEKINAITTERSTTTTETATETSATTVKGPKGDKGDPGEKGETGLKGLKGDTGMASDEDIAALMAKILTDGSDVLVGSEGDVLTS